MSSLKREKKKRKTAPYHVPETKGKKTSLATARGVNEAGEGGGLRLLGSDNTGNKPSRGEKGYFWNSLENKRNGARRKQIHFVNKRQKKKKKNR